LPKKKEKEKENEKENTQPQALKGQHIPARVAAPCYIANNPLLNKIITQSNASLFYRLSFF
jgi:formiminotetrahydrofolate cyclodeaminase